MKLTILFPSLLLTLSLQAQWLVSTPPIPDTLCAISVEPVNENVAWALAMKFSLDSAGYYFSNYDKGYFFKTNDSGQSWTGEVMPFPGSPYFSDIFAKDANSAWVCGIDNNTYASYVYKTNDGGQSWMPALTDAFIQPTSFVDFIHFFDDQHGLIMGDPAASDTDTTLHYEIYLTNDSGQNWGRLSSQHIPLPLVGDYGVAGLFDAVGDQVWFGTAMGGVYRSKNRGADWEFFQTGLAGMSSISFADTLTGLVQSFDGTQYYLGLTLDGGETWTDITPTDNQHLPASATMIPGSGYLLLCDFDNPVAGPRRTLLSKDLGETWLQIGEGDLVAWADFVSPNVGYGGEYQPADHLMRLYSYNGDPLSGILSGQELVANITTFPNPTSGLLQIKLETEQPTDFLLLLNDMHGKLVKQERIPKTNSIDSILDLHNLPAGVYNLTISTSKGSLTKQVVKS